MTFLLDVNVLIALCDSLHVHHEAAQQWFAAIGRTSWATCPSTENGFVRVVSSPSYKTVSGTPDQIASHLRNLCAQPSHAFWQDSISLLETSRFELSKLKGHQQLTDVYLAGLAAANKGRLATFDTHIPLAAIRGASRDVIEVLSIS